MMPGGAGGGSGSGDGTGGGGGGNARSPGDWPLPIRIVLVLLLLFIMTVGWAMFIRGGYDAGIFESVGLDTEWQRADPIALMVAGAFMFQVALNGGIMLILLRNRRIR